MLVGEGAIGAEPFALAARRPAEPGVPLILETPQQNPEIADDDSTADPWTCG
jgi:endonuclease IV